MRLLQLEAGDHLTITKDLFPDEIPPYAILSHTWGADEEEVTLHDIQNKQGTDKSGHLKIVFCGEQARRDGLQYFWVDTCCIDKSSSAELNEAINSMYRWYQKAEKCYVYLPDVDGDDLTQWSCRLSFRKSRWFTRGWTLQELIAPASVEFFSSSKTCLGDKKSLVQELHDITHVPTRVLREAEEDMLSEFDLEERISWSAHRGTKRPEDKAYSLLGICGLSMPMIYGEREKEAFSRLRKEFADRHPQSDPQAQARLDQCLAELRVTDPQDDKTRIEDAKGGLLKGAYRWVLNHPDLRRLRDDPHCHLLWIKGDAGKGKTMLLCGIINELQSLSSGGHLVYFFCQATDARLNSATAVLRSLVYMLSKRNVTVAKHVQKEYDDAGANVFDGPNVWYTLSRIFGDMLKDPALKPVTFVIDALDECQHDMPKLLELINKNSTTGQIKWIVSSRNEPDIEQRLHIQNSRTRLSLELKENADMVAQAVEAYIKNQVAALAERWSDPALQEHALQTLRDKAERTFLWAALVVQELRNVDEWDVEAVLDDVPPGLDELYGRMLQQIAQLSRENPRYCRQILATVSATYRPLTLAELGLLSGLPPGIVKNSENVRKIANMCGSFLTIRDDAVYFVHQSAKDYLVKDASGKLFRSGIAGIHRDIYLNSMDEMKKSLRRDMYDARHPGTSIHEMKCPDPNPLRTIRYSCVYWIDHLSDAGTTEGIQTGGVVQRFLEQKCLYWLEALALLGGLSHNIISISKLAELIKDKEGGSQVIDLVQDLVHFVRCYKHGIKAYPLQIYASGLIFTPTGSLIRGLFRREEPTWVVTKPKMRGGGNAYLQTLEGHSDRVCSVAFSPDGRHVVSASRDKTVRIWTVITGDLVNMFQGPSGRVLSVAFSPDGRLVASALNDHAVRIWVADTGDELHTMEHSDLVRSVAFSPDGRLVASASHDKTVQILAVSTGDVVHKLKHSGGVISVAFSRDGRIVTAGFDNTVQIWTAITGDLVNMFQGHSEAVSSVVFSPDGRLVASGSYDKTVRIWVADKGDELYTLKQSDLVDSVAFSPDGGLVAVGLEDMMVRIWAVYTGVEVHTLQHSDVVDSVAFSPDGRLVASASGNTVYIWAADTGASMHVFQDDTAGVTSGAFSPNGLLVSSGLYDDKVRFWSAYTSDTVEELDSHGASPVAFSPNSRLVVSGSEGETLCLWDADTGGLVQKLKCSCRVVHVVAFSPDGQFVAAALRYRELCIWTVDTGNLVHMLTQKEEIMSVAFSPDSRVVASGLVGETVCLWDADTGDLVQELEGGSRTVAFSPDGQFMAVTSCSLAMHPRHAEMKIWAIETGNPVQMLTQDEFVTTVAFSSDGRIVAAATWAETVSLWAVDTGTLLQRINIGAVSRTLALDIKDHHLLTDVGSFRVDIMADANAELPPIENPPLSNNKRIGYGISADNSWIMFDNEKILWLPVDYRRGESAVSGSKVVISCETKMLLIMRFAERAIF